MMTKGKYVTGTQSSFGTSAKILRLQAAISITYMILP